MTNDRMTNDEWRKKPLLGLPFLIGHSVIRHSSFGFTLIELLMVLAISAIALTVGIIRIGGVSLGMSQGERVAADLVADLRTAQSQAVVTAKNHYLLFSGLLKFTTYAIYRVEPGSDVQVAPARVLPDTVALAGLLNRAEFQPDGTAVLDYTYTVTCPGRAFTVTVQALWGSVSYSRK